MVIRNATPEESSAIAPLLVSAMEEILYQFIGENAYEKALSFMEKMVRKKDNQYSHEHCWVAVSEDGIVGVALIYDGAHLKVLRKPVEAALKNLFGRELKVEEETQAGEFYIDCIGVDARQQGKGIGSALLRFLIDHYCHQQGKILGLLVDRDNPKAKQLYLKVGFKPRGEKTFAGKKFDHLQFLVRSERRETKT